MPIVNGIQATRQIRTIEQADSDHTPLGSSPALLSPVESRGSRPSSCLSVGTFQWTPTPSPSGIRRSALETPISSPSHVRFGSLPVTVSPTASMGPKLQSRSLTEPRDPAMRLSEPTPPRPADTTFPDSSASYFPFMPKHPSRRATMRSSDSLPLPSIKTSFALPPVHHRIPIFAVSANLSLHTQESLEEAGFDGWLPKPVDFTRLAVILRGTFSDLLREEGRYTPSDTRAGGWFKV